MRVRGTRACAAFAPSAGIFYATVLDPHPAYTDSNVVLTNLIDVAQYNSAVIKAFSIL